MKKSLNAWSVPNDVDFTDMFRDLAAAGFAGVELNLDRVGHQVHSLTMETSDEELQAIRLAAEEAGIEICGISTSMGGGTGSNDPAVRDEQRRILLRQLELAQALGADAVLTVPGGMNIGEPAWPGDDTVTSLAEAHVNALAFYRDLKPEIEASGIQVGVENVWNGFFTSPFHMASFIDAVDSPYVGAYLDVGNMLAFSSPEPWIEILAHRIKKIHVKDFKRNAGIFSGGAWVNLLEGSANWPAIIAWLREVGYDNYLTAELEITKHKPSYLYEITSKALDIILGF